MWRNYVHIWLLTLFYYRKIYWTCGGRVGGGGVQPCVLQLVARLGIWHSLEWGGGDVTVSVLQNTSVPTFSGPLNESGQSLIWKQKSCLNFETLLFFHISLFFVPPLLSLLAGDGELCFLVYRPLCHAAGRFYFILLSFVHSSVVDLRLLFRIRACLFRHRFKTGRVP